MIAHPLIAGGFLLLLVSFLLKERWPKYSSPIILATGIGITGIVLYLLIPLVTNL